MNKSKSLNEHSSFEPLLHPLSFSPLCKISPNTMLDHLPSDPIHHFNQQFGTKNGSYESWVPFNFASKPRKPAERYDLYSSWNNNDGIQLRQVDSGETDSGVNSPPLWNNIPPGSPASRLQAIVKGQKELMDMVKKMPESQYELTLKDLVEEQTKVGNSQEECLLKGKEDHEEDEHDDRLAHEKMDSRKSSAKSGKKDKDGSTSRIINGRSNSMDNNNNKGLFLKMVFPFGMKKKSKKKKNTMKSSGSAKISPKTEGCDRTSSKYGDKDWLKKMFSSGSDRSRSSSSHHSTRNGSIGSDKSSSSIRTRRGFCSSCLPCFHYSAKGKSAE